MTGSCFIKGCKSGYNSSKTHLFQFPRKGSPELKQLWTRFIPKRDEDEVSKRILPFDFKKHRLCYLHFDDKYVVKESVVLMEGKIIASQPRKCWTLTDDAVPTMFSNDDVPGYYDVKYKKRKLPAERTPIPVKRRKTAEEEEKESWDFQTLIKRKEEIDNPCRQWITSIKGDVIQMYNFDLPETPEKQPQFKWFMEIDDSLMVNINLRGNKMPNLSRKINSIQDLNELLSTVHSMKLCEGVEGFNLITACKSGHVLRGKWFSLKCDVTDPTMTSSKLTNPKLICLECLKLKKSLMNKSYNIPRTVTKRIQTTPSSPRKAKAYFKRINKQLKRKTIMVTKLKRKVAELSLALKLIKKKFKEQSVKKMIEGVKKDLDLPDNLKKSIITSIQVSKAKSKRGRRYEGEWLLQCCLLRMKGPKSYRYMRDNDILPLPHPRTLNKLVASVPCEFGFTNFIFEQIERELKGKTPMEKQVALVFDEIKVKEGITYKSSSLRFNGFIDYGEYTEDYLELRKKPDDLLADHGLVFMARSLSSKWVQPVAVFATKDAAPGAMLAKLLISCIMRLENAGAEVRSVTCDGATMNKSMWKTFGIKGKPGDVTCKATSPWDEERDVFFVSDVPHIFKCIRNHFRKHVTVKFKGQTISYLYYRRLLEQENDRHVRASHKLTEAHLDPVLFQKMSVKLAMQLFSTSVSDSMNYYRVKKRVKELKGSEATEEFTRTLNNVFDCLNSTTPIDALRKNNKQYEELKKFRDILHLPDQPMTIIDNGTLKTVNVSPNSFASATTFQSLIVTIESTLSLVEVLATLGFKYLLTARLNQDCIEKFFGLIRSVNGDDPHPTIPNFLQIYRLLSFYCPTSRFLKGNVQTSEEHPVLITSYFDSIKEASKKNEKEKGQALKVVKDEILEKIMNGGERSKQDIIREEHDYCMGHKDPPLLFQLCGFLTFKSKLFTKCEKCKSTLSSTKEECEGAPESYFTNLKTLGGLSYPSKSLYDLIQNFVEPAVDKNLEIGKDLVGPTLQDVIDSMTEIRVPELGCCLEHRSSLIVNIVIYYITIRFYFLSRQYNKQIIKASTNTKKKMKEAKLQ